MTRNKGGVAALERALHILDAFSENNDGLSLNELAQRTGLYKSTILRLCNSLQRFGYLHRLEGGVFLLGSMTYRLGQSYERSFNLASFAMPVMQRLTQETKLGSSLWIRESGFRVCLCRVDFQVGRRHPSIRIGERWPLEAGGASSNVLRAFSAEQGSEFEAIRRTSVAVSVGEFVHELAAISCPIFLAAGNFGGALSIGGYRSGFTQKNVVRLKLKVIKAAREITRSLQGDLSQYDRLTAQPATERASKR